MLAEWQRLQVQIWEVESELKHATAAKKAGYQRLKNLLRYRGQLCLTNRLAPESGSRCVSGIEDLEHAVGYDAAKAWSTLLENLSHRPGGIPGLSRAMGEETFEAFASIAAALVEVPPIASFRSGNSALEQIIASEFKIGALDAASIEDGSLHSGSFLCTLIDHLTAKNPAGASWMQAALHRDPMLEVGQTLGEFLYNSPSLLKEEACAALCKAVRTIVTTLCEHAAVAPQGLCTLAIAVQMELEQLKLCNPAQLKDVECAVLGEIFIGRWLVPLYDPGDTAKPASAAAFAAFSKLMTAVCSNNPEAAKCNKFAMAATGDKLATNHSHGVADYLSGVCRSFVHKEAAKLAAGFFEVLTTRGQELIVKDEAPLPWPRCLVWTVGDLVKLAHRFVDADPDMMRAAEAAGVKDELVKSLSKTRAFVDTNSPVACWFPSSLLDSYADSSSTLISPVLARSNTTDARTSAGARNSGVSQVPTGPSDGSGNDHEYEMLLFGRSDTITPGFDQKPRQPRKMCFEMEEKTAKALEKATAKENAAWEGLVWRVLADPWPLEGPPDSTLVKALGALKRIHQSGPAELRLDSLLGWLEPIKDKNMQMLLTDSSPTSRRQESEMQDSFREELKKQVEIAKRMSRDVLQMHVAESLLSQSCWNSLRLLQDTASFRTMLSCEHSMRRLRDPADRPPGRERRGLDLCFIKVPSDMVPNYINDSSDAQWVSSFVNQASAKQTRASSSFQAVPSSPVNRCSYRVEVVEMHRCPVHSKFATGEYVGRVRHDTARGWNQVMKEFVKLPLNQALLDGEDALSLAANVLKLLDVLVDRLMLRCKEQDPPIGRKESVISEVYNTNEEWPDPVDVLRADEKHVRKNAATWAFEHLHVRIFPTKPTEQDIQLSQCIAKLDWLEPRHLEVPEVFLRNSLRVENATAVLRGLSTHRSPGQMLEALSHAFRSLTESACVLSQAGIAGDAGEALGADVALPLFILVLLKANPNMLESVLRYIERFTPPHQMLTEAGYAVVQARAATCFAENVRAGNLTGLRPGEWMDLMGTQEHYSVGSFIAGVDS